MPRRFALSATLLLVAAAGCESTPATPEAGPRTVRTDAPAPPPSAVVDQTQAATTDPTRPTTAIGGASEQLLAQVVTTGTAGRLIGVGLRVACSSGRLDVEIQGVTPDGRPDGVRVARGRLPASQAAPPLDLATPSRFVRTSPPRTMAVGDRFAVVLSSTGTCATLSAPDGDTYAGGDGWFDARPNAPGVWVALDLDDTGVNPAFPSDLPFETWVRP